MDFEHIQHPRIQLRRTVTPPKVKEQAVGFNGRLALLITRAVGSMWCAYIFAAFYLLSLPAAVREGIQAIVSWVAQTFLQLVLLSIIMVGQNLQSKAADKRSEQTYDDAEAILHECLEIQRHLKAQDATLSHLIAQLGSNGER